MSEEEIEQLAEKHGWEVETDNEGQIIIYTGIQKSTDNKMGATNDRQV